MIPNNITKEHIVSAINEIEKNGYPIVREPTKYFIKYKEKTYPAKYIISLSNKLANGQELLFNDFQEGTETNEFLKSRGFEIVTEDKSNLNSENEKFDLEKLILEYNKNKDFFGKRKISEEEAMQLRSAFINDFPIDKILDIPIDNYVQGKKLKDTNETNKKSFCYRLERELFGFGSIRGANAIKFGIYYSFKDDKYVFNKKFHSAEEAYEKILKQIDFLLKSGKEFTQDNDWKKMSNAFESVNEIMSLVKSKILTVYFPETIVSINSYNGVKQILTSIFHIPDNEIQQEFILNKKKLWEIKQNHPIMQNWSNFDYSTFVWRAWEEYFDNSKNFSTSEDKLDDNNQLKTGFWIVRAGSKGEEEKDILENNIITINWSAGDLSQFNDKHNLKKEFSRLNPNRTKRSVETISSELWNFAKVIKKGDIAILPQLAKGSNRNIAIAKVIDGYRYREDVPEIKNTIPVIWLHKNIPIHEFANDAKESFRKQLTVSRISKPFAIQSIIDTMKKYKILPIEFQELQNDKKTESSINDKEDVSTIESLSEFLCMPIDKLRTIEELLDEKRQIIFYGPPGTSKTYVAKKFSKYFTKNTENIEMVQFHPSYSYEDFIEGIKPKMSNTDKTTVGFEKKEGLFKHIVKKCLENPDKKFVLIIDEINRGNISKIFGELIYLLEYRNKDESIHLTYSPNEKFYIPDNLYIIATMNSADRSIAFVDYALRRRFYFIDFYPNTNLEILSKWMKKNYNGNEINTSIIVNLLKELNAIIDDRLGREFEIGYSYFMKKNLSLKYLERIKEYAIMPLMQQYFFGKKKSIEDIQTIFDKYLDENNKIFLLKS